MVPWHREHLRSRVHGPMPLCQLLALFEWGAGRNWLENEGASEMRESLRDPVGAPPWTFFRQTGRRRLGGKVGGNGRN